MIPGSAIRKLSAMTGLVASKSAEACYRLDIAPGVAFFSFLKDEKEACNELRSYNLHRVSRIVFEKQEWKCNKCNQLLSLQAHHVIFRSRWRRSDGPLDCESNLIGICARCHSEIHNE